MFNPDGNRVTEEEVDEILEDLQDIVGDTINEYLENTGLKIPHEATFFALPPSKEDTHVICMLQFLIEREVEE